MPGTAVVTRTHADARSVFTDWVYGFMAPHLRKSKQETNASNIPETSGKNLSSINTVCFWRERLHCQADLNLKRSFTHKMQFLRMGLGWGC